MTGWMSGFKWLAGFLLLTMEVGERVDGYPVVQFEYSGHQAVYAHHRGHQRIDQPPTVLFE